MMATTTTAWNMPELYDFDYDFFRPQEQKQLRNAFINFMANTKYKPLTHANELMNDYDVRMFLQSKIQLLQSFIRTQLVNIRNFSQFHQHYERVFVECLFYLVLNNVELTHFSTYNVHSIINVSKELERYQRLTHKTILNPNKVNTVIQFVLSFSSSSIASFQLNNLFYLLLNDMNDFSGKIIDRVAELLRLYHSMTYGHTITKQYLVTTIENAIRTVHFANPLVYPLYENFLNSSYIYKGPVKLVTSKYHTVASLYSILQNLSITLLGITLDDFDHEDKYLSFTSEQCYDIRLTVRRLTYLFKLYNYTFEYPLSNINKQITVQLINLIIFNRKIYHTLKPLLDLYFKYIQGFSQTKIKNLLYELLANRSFELYSIETIGYFLKLNNLQSKLSLVETKISEDDLWLTLEQIRLVTHKLYSDNIYNQIFLPIINGQCHEERSINDILTYLDNKIQLEHAKTVDIEEMKTKLIIAP